MGVEAVEAADLRGHDTAAFRGVRVGVGQGHKIRWKCRFTIHSDAMLRLGQRGRAKPDRADHAGDGGNSAEKMRAHIGDNPCLPLFCWRQK